MMKNVELKKKLEALKQYKVMKTEIENEIKVLEEEVKAEMTERAVQELIVDAYKVKYIEVVQNRFDTTAFKKEYADLYKDFTVPKAMMRFTVA